MVPWTTPMAYKASGRIVTAVPAGNRSSNSSETSTADTSPAPLPGDVAPHHEASDGEVTRGPDATPRRCRRCSASLPRNTHDQPPPAGTRGQSGESWLEPSVKTSTLWTATAPESHMEAYACGAQAKGSLSKIRSQGIGKSSHSRSWLTLGKWEFSGSNSTRSAPTTSKIATASGEGEGKRGTGALGAQQAVATAIATAPGEGEGKRGTGALGARKAVATAAHSPLALAEKAFATALPPHRQLPKPLERSPRIP